MDQNKNPGIQGALAAGFLQIDEEGYFHSEGVRWTDPLLCSSLLKNLKLNESKSFVSLYNEKELLVEAFDEPYVVQDVELCTESLGRIYLPYGVTFEFKLNSLRVDSWDRFHGLTSTGIPFVLSHKAQNHFFNLVESFDDTGFIFKQKRIEIPEYWSPQPQVESEQYWSQIYHTEENPGWNMNAPAPALVDMLPRLKLPLSRVLVLGAGEGHDAAYFAKEGHKVTAVDISPEAVKRGQQKYSQYSNLKFVEADIFKISPEWHGQFDLVFEHTCFCAVNPSLRDSLIKVWSKCLAPKGYLMAVLFAMEKPEGPPFGGTEWEYRKRLQDYFQFIFWGRWRNSHPRRQGRELFIYAQKKDK